MTADIASASAVGIAVVAEWHPETRQPDRIHGVIAWTDRGDRHYYPVVPALLATGGQLPHVTQDHTDPKVPEQLQFNLGGPGRPTSCGRTWRTWALPSVPTDLRDATLAEVTEALASQLGGCA